MSKFLYFLGGCAAGALALTAVQTWNECNSSSSGSSDSYDEDEGEAMSSQEATEQCMESVAEAFAAEAATATQVAGGSEAPSAQNMDVLGQQLAASIVSIVGQFMQQQNAHHAQKGQNEAEGSASPSASAQDAAEDPCEPVLPDFSKAAAQGQAG